MQAAKRERDSLHLSLQASRKQCSDAAAEVHIAEAAVTEHTKAVSPNLSS